MPGLEAGAAGAAVPGRAQRGLDGGTATVAAGGSAPWRRPRPPPDPPYTPGLVGAWRSRDAGQAHPVGARCAQGFVVHPGGRGADSSAAGTTCPVVPRGVPRVPWCPAADGAAGPGRADTMSRQGGRGTESKKMVTAGSARRAHGVGHPGNRPGAAVFGPGPQRPVRRGRAAVSGTGRSR